MTVRADITGRYANRMYAYEPSDVKLCKCCTHLLSASRVRLFLTDYMFLSLSTEQHAESQEAPEV